MSRCGSLASAPFATTLFSSLQKVDVKQRRQLAADFALMNDGPAQYSVPRGRTLGTSSCFHQFFKKEFTSATYFVFSQIAAFPFNADRRIPALVRVDRLQSLTAW